MLNFKVIFTSIIVADDTCHGDLQAWMGKEGKVLVSSSNVHAVNRRWNSAASTGNIETLHQSLLPASRDIQQMPVFLSMFSWTRAPPWHVSKAQDCHVRLRMTQLPETGELSAPRTGHSRPFMLAEARNIPPFLLKSFVPQHFTANICRRYVDQVPMHLLFESFFQKYTSKKLLTPVLLVTDLADTKWCKKSEKSLKPRHMGTQQELWILTIQGLDGFHKYLHPFFLEISSLSFGMV